MKLTLEELETYYPKSLVSEFLRIFGQETTEKFLVIFGGTNLRVPSQKDLRKMEDEVAMYKRLVSTTTNTSFVLVRAQLEAKFGIKTKEIMAIWKRLSKARQLATDIEEADKAVSRHRRPSGKRKG